MATYKPEGKGKADKAMWASFFGDALNLSVVERITRLTKWLADSLPDRFVAIWRTLSGTVHDKRRPEDYHQSLEKVTVSDKVLDPESCLAVAALLLERGYPVELDPPVAAWDEEEKRFFNT